MNTTTRWRAVVERDVTCDEQFVFAVRTTGIFCRPSCSARRPLRKNVTFFDSNALALKAGFRACLRCRPTEPKRTMEALCRLLERAEPTPTLAELSKEAKLSPTHLQRVFTRALGLSPKQYALAKRAERVKTQLREASSVTEAIYAAGYGASSRFYEQASALLGTTPTRYRQGDFRLRYSITGSRLGRVLVATTEHGVCAVLLGDSNAAVVNELNERFPQAVKQRGDVQLARDVVRAIDTGSDVQLPLDIRGTAFQHRVWRALQTIPRGTTRSYAEVATSLGLPRGARAVARACAANPAAVLVPCHRVVRGDGDLSGYRWGLERKRRLLRAEAPSSVRSKAAS